MDAILAWFSADKLSAIGFATLRVAVIVLVAYVTVRLVRRGLGKLSTAMLNRMEKRDEQPGGELERRAQTLSALIVTTAVVVIWVFAVMMALQEVGFDIGPLLAGAGVLGLAIGFGAQNLVRDVLTGALMLIENQVRVGDVAEVNGKSGLVERINLRTIVLRSLDGTVHILPNGTITGVSNMTYGFSYYLFDVGVAYKEDTDRVVAVLEDLADDLRGDEELGPHILEPLEVLGVDKFADSAVIVKVRLKTKPLKQWAVGREMNRRIKKKFDELGIEIPFPHRSIYFGEASKPIAITRGAENGEARPNRSSAAAESATSSIP